MTAKFSTEEWLHHQPLGEGDHPPNPTTSPPKPDNFTDRKKAIFFLMKTEKIERSVSCLSTKCSKYALVADGFLEVRRPAP